ncbi:MAG: hypothetical protein ACRCT1_22010 [Microcoleaceae cyanobacterium]|jgi:hypothetical protein
MLVTKKGIPEELRYGIYYVVFGSLAGEDYLVKYYFWEGPYPFKIAQKKLQQLKDYYQNDPGFILIKYQGPD